jgi:hypothetical protein
VLYSIVICKCLQMPQTTGCRLQWHCKFHLCTLPSLAAHVLTVPVQILKQMLEQTEQEPNQKLPVSAELATGHRPMSCAFDGLS